MAPTYNQQIPEGDAFVEPRNVETVRGLLTAAAELGLESSVVRTQQGGYLAPVKVVAKFQESVEDDTATITSAPSTEEEDEETEETEEEPEVEDEETDAPPAKNASKADWEAYAVANGYEPDEGLTKEQLIERFGASE